MKISLLMLGFLVMTNRIISQDSSPNMVKDSTKTLFSSANIRTIGLYIAPEIQIGQLAGSFTGFGGASGMVLLNSKWAFGATVSMNRGRNFTPTDISATKSLELHTMMGGLRIEYSLKPHKVVHLSFPLTLGFGHAQVDSVDRFHNFPDSLDHFNGDHHGRNSFNNRSSTFGFVQPGVNVDINLFKYGKFFIGASYRIATNVRNRASEYALTTQNLSGVNVQIGLKLGLFNYRLKR